MKIIILAALLFASGCATLLPSETQTTKPQFKTFENAQQSYESVQLNKSTISDVKSKGFDPANTSNTTLYSYGEIARTLLTVNQNYEGTFDIVNKCVAAKERCNGFEIVYSENKNARVGDFLLDFTGFVKEAEITGWSFRVGFIFIDDIVVYKSYAGIPHKYEYNKKVTPLGPFQNSGEGILGNAAKQGISDLKSRF